MRPSDQEYQEALVYLRAKLSEPQPEVDRWLNSIVDAWIAKRKIGRRTGARG